MSSAVTGFLCLTLLLPFSLTAQLDTARESGQNEISTKTSEKYINAVGNRSTEYQNKIEQSTEKYLDKLKTQEQILFQQLNKVDPNAAVRIFEGSQQKYNQLQNDLKSNADNVLKACGKYVPGIDSAVTSLKFLQQNNITDKLGDNFNQVKSALSKVKALEDQFKKTDNVEDFIKEREQYLQQQLSSYHLPGLQQYNLQAAYYAQQINELKEAWDDPSKAEEKAMKILNKIPAFQDFMKRNSMIAGLFNIPDDYGASGLGGLQTKDQVQKMMQQSMAFLGPSGAQTAQQNIGDGQSMLTGLRDKLNQGGNDLAMPNGQMNNQHTKTFLKRIEYGVNIQSTRSTSFLPSQTEFALTAGYKLNERNTIGIGVSYNVGWGQDIRHISISSRGMGLRAFGDFKIKGSFYGSGGFEYNYTQPFTSVSQLRIPGLWQKSGLVGITKMVSLSGKLVKKTKFQLLWNFLSYYQTPQTQPIIFRIGYNF